MSEAVDVSVLGDLDLIRAEANVRKMYDQRLSLEQDADDVEALHGKLAKELRSRSLVYEPLSVVKTRHAILKALPNTDDATRQKYADEGIALPDGTFYIPDEAHLHAAVRLVGQAADPQAAMQHIIERAHAMGMEHALPPAWQVNPADPTGAPQVGPGAHSIPGPAGQDPSMQPGAKAPATKPVAPGAPAGPPGAPAGAPAGGAPGAPAAPFDPDNDNDGPPDPNRPRPGLMKRIGSAIAKAMGAEFDEDAFVAELQSHVQLDPDLDYAVVRKSVEDQYTLGPVYMPNTIDAHGEWVTAEDLQKSMWDYVRENGDDRTVYLQHSTQPAGEWVEIMTWPHEVKATMTKSVDGVQKAVETVFPAGTTYMGVVWKDWSWDLVKTGKVTGFSMGGYAQRVEAELPA